MSHRGRHRKKKMRSEYGGVSAVGGNSDENAAVLVNAILSNASLSTVYGLYNNACWDI